VALLCALAWALHEWMNLHGRKRAAIALALLGLIGITHIGVFGSALILVAATLVAFAATQGREGFLKVARLATFAIPMAALAGAVVFWRFDPARVQKLIHAISEPSQFLASGPQPPGMRLPGGFGWFPMTAFALAVIPGAAITWFRRKSLSPGTIALIAGAAVTVIALTGPWVTGDKMFRLQMNAAPLALICLLFAILQIPRTWVRGAAGFVILGLLLTPSIFRIRSGGHPNISPEAHAELRQLTALIEKPELTLIVARHGLEWWTAWTLHTHIAQAQAVTPEDWQDYDSVCFLEEKRGGMGMFPGPGFGPSGMGGPGQGGPAWFDQLMRLVSGAPGGPAMRPPLPPGGRPLPQGFGGPPQGPMRGGPPLGPPPGGPGQHPGPGRRGMPMGMMGAPIPEGAITLHDGEHLRLARVPAAPAFVREGQRVRG